LLKTILITGIRGAGGGSFAEYVLENHPGIDVHGLARWRSGAEIRDIQGVTTHECDLLDFGAITSVIQGVTPDAVIHFASYADVKASFSNRLAVLENNIMGTANLFEALRQHCPETIAHHISTSEVYGCVTQADIPIKESCPFRPASPYAVSKITQDFLAELYWRVDGMKIIRSRMFSYMSPRRGDLFATSFARQIALIEQGKKRELVHGNLDSIRTILDPRDAMEAYWLATTKGHSGEVYNIGGDASLPVGDFLKLLISYASCAIPTRLDSDLLRPVDVTLQIPDTTRFKKLTGWQPRYMLAETAEYMLFHAREWVKKQ